jgi:hypothetical protein
MKLVQVCVGWRNFSISRNWYLDSNCFDYRGALNEQESRCSSVRTVTALRSERPAFSSPTEEMKEFYHFVTFSGKPLGPS